jgi:hypothetical protein
MRLPRSVRDINQSSKGEFVEKEDLYAKDVSAVQWRKSSRSIFACVEVGALGGGAVVLRDSKAPDRGDLRFTSQEWAAFRDSVRDGEFG